MFFWVRILPQMVTLTVILIISIYTMFSIEPFSSEGPALADNNILKCLQCLTLKGTLGVYWNPRGMKLSIFSKRFACKDREFTGVLMPFLIDPKSSFVWVSRWVPNVRRFQVLQKRQVSMHGGRILQTWTNPCHKARVYIIGTGFPGF